MQRVVSLLLLAALFASVSAARVPDEDNVLSPRFMELQFSAPPPAQAQPQQSPPQPKQAPAPTAQTPAAPPAAAASAPAQTAVQKPQQAAPDAKGPAAPAPTVKKTSALMDAKHKVLKSQLDVAKAREAVLKSQGRLFMARLRLQGIFAKIAENEAKIGAADALHKQAVKARELGYKQLRNDTVAAAELREKRRDAKVARDESSNAYQALLFQLKYHQSKQAGLTKAKDTAGAKTEQTKIDTLHPKVTAAKADLVAKRAALKAARDAARKAIHKAARTRGHAFVHNKIAHKTEKIMRRAKNALAALHVQAKHTGDKVKTLESKVENKRKELLDLQVKAKFARKELRELRAKYKLKPLPEAVAPKSDAGGKGGKKTQPDAPPVLENKRSVDSSAKPAQKDVATQAKAPAPALKTNAKAEPEIADVI